MAEHLTPEQTERLAEHLHDDVGGCCVDPWPCKWAEFGRAAARNLAPVVADIIEQARADERKGGDAASWPRPMSSQDLGEHDELASLIDWHRLNTYCTQRAEEAS